MISKFFFRLQNNSQNCERLGSRIDNFPCPVVMLLDYKFLVPRESGIGTILIRQYTFLAAKTYQVQTTVLFLLLMNVSSTAGWQDLNPRMKNRWCRGVSAMFFPSWPGKICSFDKYVEFCPVARLGVPEISFNFNGEFPVPKAVSKTNKSTRTSVAGGGRTTRSSWSVGDGVCVCVCQGLGVCLPQMCGIAHPSNERITT